MNQTLMPPISHLAQSASVPDSRDSAACKEQQQTVDWDDLVHDLRQPLSTIESLAYYLELVCADPKARTHLQQIQELIGEANTILEHASLEPAC